MFINPNVLFLRNAGWLCWQEYFVYVTLWVEIDGRAGSITWYILVRLRYLIDSGTFSRFLCFEFAGVWGACLPGTLTVFCFACSLDQSNESMLIWFQESIANSADGMLLSAPDSLVVSITKNHGFSGDEEHNAATLVTTPRKSRGKSFGIDGLDSLIFTYKVQILVKHVFFSLSILAYSI